MKYLKYFKTEANWTAYKDGEDFILPNVSYIEETKGVSFEPKKPKKAFVLRAKYNATPDNLVAFNGASNIKALKVNGTPITIEPIKNENTAFDVLGENISLDMETGVATFPESYVIKSPVSSWSFKAKDPNYVINENTYVCMLGMMDGMTLAQPMSLEEALGYGFTTNDGVTLEAINEFLTEINMMIQSGTQIGFTLMDVDMNSQTFTFIDTEHQTSVTTGGLSTYSFDNEGLYDVEIELADPVIKDIQFAETQLIGIEIGDGITYIGDHAFYNCNALTNAVIGNSVTSIGYRAFENCSSLESVNIPNSITYIENYAFYNCKGLAGELVIPDSVTSIGDNAFSACSGLTELTIGSGVITIGTYAFSSCSSLTSITCYAQTAPTIYNSTFNAINKGGTLYYPEGSDYSNWLSRLRSYYWNMMITAHYNVTSSSNYLALYTTSNISHLYVNGVEVTNFGYSYSFKSKGSYTIQILLKDDVGDIKNMFTNVKALNSVIIDNSGVTSIGYGAFDGCSGLKDITIGSGVTTIGEYAFNNCKALTSIVIPDSVTTIGERAFYYCSRLTGELIIPDSVTSIGDYAFANCEGLTTITIPDSVTTIGLSAFQSCKGLTSIVIPDSVTSIGSGAFSYCPGLTSIVVSSGNTVYDSRENCNCLIETTTNRLIKGCNNSFIPNGVTYIGDAFTNCTGLTSIVIPDSVTSIGGAAFSGCSGLTGELIIPDSVTTIGGNAFQSCKALTSVVIGTGITSIGTYAFSYCSGLTSITCLAPTAPSIESYTFREVKQNGTLYVPAGSDYSSWMSTSDYYLGKYNWTIQYI